MTDELIPSNTLHRLKQEIRLLKTTLSNLLQERDDLIYHICPKLRAIYAKEIGDYQIRANYRELKILELKRKIEITRAALNREKHISEKEVTEKVSQEYQQFHQRVDEEFQNSKKFQDDETAREEKRRSYQEQWKQRYGSDKDSNKESDKNRNSDSNTDKGSNNDFDGGSEEHFKEEESGTDHATHTSKRSDIPNAKELYRKIVKKLHPDMNPNASEHEMELFRRATAAYEDGDIVTLQEIYDEIFELGSEAISQEETYESLTELRDRLKKQIEQAATEINEIKNSFPYTQKELLENPEAIRAKQEAISQLITEYEREIERLQKMLDDINNEMEELQRRKNR